MTKNELTQKSEQNNSMEQKQIQAPLGTQLPENEDVIKLLKDMKSIFKNAQPVLQMVMTLKDFSGTLNYF